MALISEEKITMKVKQREKNKEKNVEKWKKERSLGARAYLNNLSPWGIMKKKEV